ncbi:MAG: hypothetical protein EZS28_008446 [Streblomastix strix]|uniref:Uncharacterized protein n=1 Tax=Streblomastix strix TaxID=222440 RepID=A0A5J4WLS3_9EUKA|nr:MAG: hypothetical protein EZS28_008446 [Streblomastix strix]
MEEEQKGAQNRMEKDESSEDDDDLFGCPGGDQCDLNLSPVQGGLQIIELLAAVEIDRSERQNTEKYSAYLERPRQCAQSRNPKIQDRVQGKPRSTLEFIQDNLVRTGRRRYNPDLELFRQLLESNVCDPKKERRLKEDPGQSNSKQRIENRVFQVGRNNSHSKKLQYPTIGQKQQTCIKLSTTLEQQKRCDRIYALASMVTPIATKECRLEFQRPREPLLNASNQQFLKPGSDSAQESSSIQTIF